MSGATWTACKLGGGLLFDNANDVVTVPHADKLPFSGAITLAAWANNSTLDFYDLVVAKSNTGTYNGNYWLGTVGQNITFGFTVNGNFLTFNTDFNNQLKLKTNTWYHLAATFDDATDQVRIYRDGSQVYSATTNKSPDASVGPVTIGRAIWGDPWDGRLDDVRIYDRVLSAEEIDALAAGG